MGEEPLDDEEREGALGAIVETLALSGDPDLVHLGEALRAGGTLTAMWADHGEEAVVSLAVPPGHPLVRAGELEDAVLDVVQRAVATCGVHVERVRITLALAKSGWRTAPKEELPLRLGGRFDREADPLKRGGFGVIYKAVDTVTGSDVALKVLRLRGDLNATERLQFHKRFQREMQLMSQLRHPNLMEVLWFGEEPTGVLWYAMPLAEGSLGDRLGEFPDDPNRILTVLTSICDGVEYLHQEGVVHRDLSPGNVLCMPDGRWVVSDLGLAFDLDRELTQLTTTGMSMGTAGYRPPDAEAQRAKTAQPTWDIYSLGQLLADMTAGQSYSDRSGALPTSGVFAPAIRRACQSDPGRRFSSIHELVVECRNLVELTTNWEGPDERRTRLAAELADAATAQRAVHELTLVLDQGESIEPFVSALCGLDDDRIEQLCITAPEDLRTLALGVIDEMPGSYTQFEQLDQIAHFLIAASEALEDDSVSKQTLQWVLEVGHQWNRWNVQGMADAYLRRLAEASPETVSRALRATEPTAVPDDLSWLHPAARPTPPRQVDTPYDEEPF